MEMVIDNRSKDTEWWGCWRWGQWTWW